MNPIGGSRFVLIGSNSVWGVGSHEGSCSVLFGGIAVFLGLNVYKSSIMYVSFWFTIVNDSVANIPHFRTGAGRKECGEKKLFKALETHQ